MNITTRSEALVKGLTRYFTGRPCSRGHTDYRLVADYNCVSCVRARRIVKKQQGVCRDCKRVTRQNKTFCQRCLNKQKWNNRRRFFKLSRKRFNELRRSQNNECGICRNRFDKVSNIQIDHNHACCASKPTCGRCIRGLLCRACNRLLGCALDSSIVLKQAAEYLDAHTI